MAHDYSMKDRTSDVLNDHNKNIDFASLLLSPDVLTGLSQAGFERPSPIQLKAIPLGRCGLDLIVQAKSGTGKTCVFSVIILESLDLQCANVQALVLTPTREIATQVQGVIQSIGGAFLGLRCHTFIGGTLFGPDRQKLKKCHIAVGTPGRVKQLIEYSVMPTDSIRLFVLDEADKLLEEKFQDQINWIYNHLPVNKQMLALSATYPETLARGLTAYMRDPTFVRLNPRNVALKGIKQFYKIVPGHLLPHKAFEIKVQHLLQLFTQVSFSQCLVFSNLSSRAQNLSDILCENGWPSTCISGNQDQTQRHSAMSMLKTFQCRVLISTDLTARGIDAENVDLIINLDVPSDVKTYMHRIGRAGRFGSKGAAVTLASEGNEETLLRNIQHQSHVKLHCLPDPVPSDLVNSLSVSADSTDNHLSSSQAEDDNSVQFEDNGSDAEEQTEEPELVAKTPSDDVMLNSKEQSAFVCKDTLDVSQRTLCTDDNAETGGMSSQSSQVGQKSWVGRRSYISARSCVSQKSKFNQKSQVTQSSKVTRRSQVNQGGDSSSHMPWKTPASLTDQSCQVDTLSSPFHTSSPMDRKIPSLAEIFRSSSKQEVKWTWQKAADDFERFTSGRSESVIESAYPGVDEIEDNTEMSQTESNSVAGNVLLKCESEGNGNIMRIAEEHNGSQSSVVTLHEPDVENRKESPQLSDDEEINISGNPSDFTALTRSDSNHGSSLNEEQLREELREDESGVRSTPNGKEDIHPETSASPVENEQEEADQDIREDDASESHHSTRIRQQGSDVESKESYKIHFSWRPTLEYFDNLVAEDITGLLITEDSGHENDKSALGDVPTDSKFKSAGARPKSSPSNDDDRDLTNASSPGAWRPVSPKEGTPARERQLGDTEGRAAPKQSRKEKSSPQRSELNQPNPMGRAVHLPRSSQTAGKPGASQGVSATVERSSGDVASQKDAVASKRQSSQEMDKPGYDPIWQFYTSFLTSQEDTSSDDSDSRSQDSSSEGSDDADEIRESDNQDRMRDVSDMFTPALKDPDKRNPAFHQHESMAQHNGNHGWSHLPYAPSVSPADYYGVPAAKTPYYYGYPTKHGSGNQYDMMYNGQYTYWPYM